MAQQDEGIMALNAASTGAPPEQEQEVDMKEFRRQAYPVVKESVREVAPEGYGEMQALLSSELAGAGDLDPEGIEDLLEIVDYINDNPKEYAKVRAALIKEGVIEEGDFPKEMDVEYFATLEVVLQEASMKAGAQAAEIAQGPVDMMPPQGFAKGGIAEAAQLVASRGRYGDTMLAHITPAEARLLKARGGSGTINPETGLPEFFKKFFKKVGNAISGAVKSVVAAVKPVVKKVLASPIGRIAVTVGLTMIGVPPPVASALVTKAAGGTWKDALKSAAVSYLSGPTGPIGSYVAKATPFLSGLNPAVATGIRSGLTATGASLLTGSNLKQAVTAGVTSGLMAGIDAARNPVPAAATGEQAGAPVRDMTTRADSATGTADAPFTLASASSAPGALDPNNVFSDATSAAVQGNAPTGTSSSRFADFTGTPEANFTPAPNFSPAAVGGATEANFTQVAPLSASARFADFTQGAGPVVPPPPAPTSWWDKTKEVYNDAKDFYNENISPSGIREAGETGAQEAGQKAQDALLTRNPSASQKAQDLAYTNAYESAKPGIISQYAPLVGTGLGVMALGGGFKEKEPEQLPMADRISAPMEIPEMLTTPMQNLPGVIYDSKGNIVGSKPWDPYTSSRSDGRPTEVSTPGIMSLQLPPNYLPPLGSPTMGTGNVPQPYNTSAMYYNVMPPQRLNRGGIAGFAQGGYPRRIGQISGPGTETSDDIPAMLSDGEFVMTARAVRGAGNGSRREGAKKMYAMMHQLEKNAARG